MVITEQAINILNQMGADLGAVQKRLQSSVINDQSAFVANSAAQSTVTSANVALATTKFTQAQIIQKSGISTMNIEQSIIKAYLKLLP
ncbi:MAG: flagellin [Acidithiobacillus sp.]